MRILVCDEDESYVDDLIAKLKSFSCDEELIFESYTDTPGIARQIQKGVPKDFDLAYIGDIIHGRNGFELARMIRERNPECIVIFLCDDYKYMHEGFRAYAFQMLLKQQNKYVESEFRRALKVYKRIHFQVKIHTNSGKDISVIPEDVHYIETHGDQVTLATDHYRYQGVIKNLKEVKVLLAEGYHFFQMHPQYFVNIEHIELIRCGELRMANGDSVPTSAMNREIIDETIQSYIDFY